VFRLIVAIPGLLLIYASAWKLFAPAASEPMLRWWGIADAYLLLTTLGIGVIEFGVGVLLTFKVRSLMVRLVGLGLFVMFSILLVVMLSHADAPPCACLGKPLGLIPTRWQLVSSLGRNLILMGILIWPIEDTRRPAGLTAPAPG
jgi:hypothetical protein